MLSPLYRRCGVELTRITPGHDYQVRMATTPGAWIPCLEKYQIKLCDRLWHHVRAMAMPCSVYDVLENVQFKTKKALWDATLELAQLSNVSELGKNPVAVYLRDMVISHLADLAGLEQDRIVKAALVRFRGLYNPRINTGRDRGVFQSRQQAARNARYRFWKLGQDPSCIELSSAPMKDWEHFKEFFTLADDFLEEHNCIRCSDYIAGPGGHIHIEMRPKHVFRLQRQLLNHPWVLFAFCDPRDDQHLLDNCPEASVHRKHRRMPWHPLYRRWRERNPRVEYPVMAWSSIKSGKAIAFRGDSMAVCKELTTAEWRLFDIAQTWEMQEEHLAFAQAFTEYAIRSDKPEALLTYEEVEALTTEQLIDGFRADIKRLKLPWSRYRSYVYNIETRMELKTQAFSGDTGHWYGPEGFRIAEKAYDQSRRRRKDAWIEYSGVDTPSIVPFGSIIGIPSAGTISITGMPSTAAITANGSYSMSICVSSTSGENSDPRQIESSESVSDSPNERGVFRCSHAGASNVEGAGIASPDVRGAEGPSQGGETDVVDGESAPGTVETGDLSDRTGIAMGFTSSSRTRLPEPSRCASPL